MQGVCFIMILTSYLASVFKPPNFYFGSPTQNLFVPIMIMMYSIILSCHSWTSCVEWLSVRWKLWVLGGSFSHTVFYRFLYVLDCEVRGCREFGNFYFQKIDILSVFQCSQVLHKVFLNLFTIIRGGGDCLSSQYRNVVHHWSHSSSQYRNFCQPRVVKRFANRLGDWYPVSTRILFTIGYISACIFSRAWFCDLSVRHYALRALIHYVQHSSSLVH